jgi:putative membrane protein
MPYSKINPDDMILRDHLAFDRTILANERTLLAYLRTAIALLASGATLWKVFSEERTMIVLGAILLSLGGLAALAGIWRFVSVSRRLSATYETPSK